MLPVVRTQTAQADLSAALEYLEERSPPAAERLANAIEARCRLLGQFPQMGRARDEIRPGLRSVAVEKYLIFHQITASAVEVVRILHGSRDVERILREEDEQ
jgi:toxin ParE1/3/4